MTTDFSCAVFQFVFRYQYAGRVRVIVEGEYTQDELVGTEDGLDCKTLYEEGASVFGMPSLKQCPSPLPAQKLTTQVQATVATLG